jgi:hypothetical protein
MKRLALAALLVAIALPRASRGGDAAADAVQLSRLVISEGAYRKMHDAGLEQARRFLESWLAQNRITRPPEFYARVSQEFDGIMPSYQEVVDLQAGLLVKYYTDAEIRELNAFYRTPLGQKMIRVMPEAAADANAQMLAMMQQRLPGMMKRLQAELGGKQPPAKAAPAAASGVANPGAPR